MSLDPAPGRRNSPLMGRERWRLGRLLELWDHLVDPKVGIVRAVAEFPIDDDDPNFFHYLSRACDASPFTGVRNFGYNGGVSTVRHVAVAKAIGEAVERYCGAIYDRRSLTYASYAELGHLATNPDDYALYRTDQLNQDSFPCKPFTANTTVAWTAGRSLITGAPVLVPAAMVYVPYHFSKSRSEPPITQSISTGLACGCSVAEAMLSGLCEAVERDAFTLTWQARMSRPRISHESLPGAVRDRLERFAKVRLRVEIMDISTDIRIPAILMVAIGDSPTSPAFAVATAADPCPETALIKCIEELAHTRKFAKHLMMTAPEVPIQAAEAHPAVVGQDDHVRFYCSPAARPFIEFCWASPQMGAFSDLPRGASAGGELSAEAKLQAAVAELARCGLEPVVCDLTTPDVRALGLSVVRVVVPGLHPLFMGYRARALGGRRLYTVPQVLGSTALDPAGPDNHYPHPFP